MDDLLDFDLQDSSKLRWENGSESPILEPIASKYKDSSRWENMVESSILEPIASKYKLKLKYGGYFRLAKNSRKKRYCFGFQKSIFMDTSSYTFEDLNEEVRNRYPSKRDSTFFILFVDKYAVDQSYIMLDSDENFKEMLNMYDNEKEVTIFVTTDNTNLGDNGLKKRGQDEVISEPHEDDDSDNCPSEESYHSHLTSDIEDEGLNYESGSYSNAKKNLTMKVNSRFSNVTYFRRALNHFRGDFFKRHFRGDFFYFKLWGAAIAYCVNDHDRLLDEIAAVRKEAITYLNDNHNKIWSRCKFGTTAKCDYITNNISEGFNSWIGDLRYRPVLDLLDAIREKLMRRFDKKRRIVKKWKGSLVPKAKIYVSNITKNLGEYAVSRSSDNRAEVTYKGKRWEVTLDDKKCSCRVWQVKGLPCVHAAAFITSIRDINWDKYVDPYFTVENYKKAYALEITTIPTKDQWVRIETQEMIYPPKIKRPPGRPRKNRIVPRDEPKKRRKCHRCSEYGHHAKKCKNSASQNSDRCCPSTSKRGSDKNAEAPGIRF